MDRHDNIPMHVNGVSTALTLAIEELDRLTDELRLQSAEKIMNGSFVRTEQLLSTLGNVQDFRQNMRQMASQWERKVFRRPNPSTLSSRQRNKSTILRVRIGNETIACPRASQTFVEVLRRIGFPRIVPLGLKISGVNLVSSVRPSTQLQYTEVDGYYVATHSNTATKKGLLEEISTTLGVPLIIDIAA